MNFNEWIVKMCRNELFIFWQSWFSPRCCEYWDLGPWSYCLETCSACSLGEILLTECYCKLYILYIANFCTSGSQCIWRAVEYAADNLRIKDEFFCFAHLRWCHNDFWVVDAATIKILDAHPLWNHQGWSEQKKSHFLFTFVVKMCYLCILSARFICQKYYNINSLVPFE